MIIQFIMPHSLDAKDTDWSFKAWLVKNVLVW